MSKEYPLPVQKRAPCYGCPFWQPFCAFLWSAPNGPEKHVAPLRIADRRFGNNVN